MVYTYTRKRKLMKGKKERNRKEKKRKEKQTKTNMRLGRRPTREGITLMFASTISLRYVQLMDQQKDDTIRPDGR